MKTEIQESEAGQMILFALFFLLVLVTASTALVGYTTLQIKGSRQAYSQTQAQALAEAGIEKAIYELNQNGNYAGESNTSLGAGTFSITIASIDGNNKRITATGYVPNSSAPVSSKTIKATATIDATTVAFNFGVQVGVGGMTMDNQTVVNGNIFSNGNISGSGTITGDAIVAAGTAATADQEWTVQTSDFAFGNSAARHDVAQSFSPTITGQLNKIKLYLKKVGNPSNLVFRVVTDDTNEPSRNDLATGTMAASLVTANYGWIEGTFSSAPALTSGQKYWLMVSANIDSSNYYVLGLDGANGYANQKGVYSDDWDTGNPDWDNANGDFNFQTYMAGVTTSLAGVRVDGDVYADSLIDCDVGGDAYYLNNDSCEVDGTEFPGTPPQGPQALPVSDAQIIEWKGTASDGGTIAGPYVVEGAETLGPSKIDGDLTVNGVLTLSGPVWVKGNVIINNGSTLQVDAALGNNGAILLADDPINQATKGLITISNNAILRGNNNPNSYPMLLSTKSTGTAIDLGNNSTGVIYYASQAKIDVSNLAGASQLTGYAIHLNENSSVTYATGLQSATFSNGPGGSWAFLSGSYVIID
jgi:hypothetical protein